MILIQSADLPIFERWQLTTYPIGPGSIQSPEIMRDAILITSGMGLRQAGEAIYSKLGYDSKSCAIKISRSQAVSIFPKNQDVEIYAELDLDYKFQRDPRFLDFWKGFLDALIWQATDDDGEPLDTLGASISSFYEEDLENLWGDCVRFYSHFEHLISEATYNRSIPEDSNSVQEVAGHDYCLTRNEHGAGFWDGDWKEEVAQILTEAAHACDPVYLEYDPEGDQLITI